MTRMTRARTSLTAAAVSALLSLAALGPAHAAPTCVAATTRDAISTTVTGCDTTLIADIAPASAPATASNPTSGDALQVATGADPVALSSRPGSPNTIYLDFTGHTITGSDWNSTLAENPAVFSSFDMDKDPATFSAGENSVIAQTWSQTVADYAPFDVNITTVDPGPAALTRGVRVVVTASTGHRIASCSSCTGWAYLNTFPTPGRGSTTNNIALVYADLLYNYSGYLAQTVSHEVGHTLGLHHDGGSGKEYQQTDDLWNPIMGGGTQAPLSTWSNGDYAGASNTEDDIATIASQLGFLPDDFPVTPATATTAAPLPALTSPTTGLISGPTDTDAFILTVKAGTKIAITPTVTDGNLDVAATLTAADGTIVTDARPGTNATYDDQGRPIIVYNADAKRVINLAANLTITQAGTYTLTVSGSGNRDGATAPFTIGQYSNYGINGLYTITVTPPKVVTPVIVTKAITIARGKVASVALKITGGKPAYYVGVKGGTLPAGVKMSNRGILTGKAIKAGTYKVTVTVFDSNLAGATSTLTITIR